MEEITKNEVIDEEPQEEVPHEKTVRLMSPTRMVVRRFFRSKLSIVGLIMVVCLFLFSFLGPVVYTNWEETVPDKSGKVDYSISTKEYINCPPKNDKTIDSKIL